ncbi:MAG: hypothetical protein IK081_00850 [Lachnospiraceae bacterium]|nr:hypothetical protein [Lachnospiraceae bacterium]
MNEDKEIKKSELEQPEAEKADEKKPEAQKADAQKPEEVKAEKADAKDSEEKPEEKKAEEKKADDKKADEKKADDKKAEEKKAAPKKAPKAEATDNVIKKPLLSEAAINRLKGLIFPVVVTLILLGGVYLVLHMKNTGEKEAAIKINVYDGGKDPIILENDKLKLTMDPVTTAFDIEVKSTGAVWHSVPTDEEVSADPLVGFETDEYNKLHSTLLMSYTNEAGAETKYNNYKNSIQNGVYQIEATNDYIKMMYSIGTIEKEYQVPPVLTEPKMKEWLDLIRANDDDADTVKMFYKKYDINNPGKKDNVEELKATYPLYETEIIYVLDPKTKEQYKKEFAKYFERAGYTAEQYEEDKALSSRETTSKTPAYNVNVYYRLDGEDLVVEIPYKEIEYKAANPIYTLTVLPYFGAGSQDDEGFLMVPEGGGAVIRFNNGKGQNSRAYYSDMYGWDIGLVRKELVHETRSDFNCFGISKGDNSFICIMEDGSSYGYVQADVGGRDNSFNFVNTTYHAVLREQYDVGSVANTAVYVFMPELPDESLKQRYHFVNSGSYVDMAKEYSEYLKEKNPEAFAVNQETDAPVVVEIVAAADKIKQILGVPTSRPLKLTTYKEAREMITELKNDGVNNLSVKLSGWANGGVSQKIMKKVKLVSACGSKKDLTNLAQEAKNLGVDLYLDGVTLFEYNSKLWDGFNSFTDAARFISRERAKIYQYSKVTYAQRENSESYYMLHADLANQITHTLFDATQSYGANVSFRNIGQDLAGDYYMKKITTRESAKNTEEQTLFEMSKSSKIMINNGNEYAAVHSDVITNMDFHGSEYTIIDEFIPFYQIALHGYKNYVGEPINLAANPEKELLLSVEYGAGLYFTFMKESPFALQKTLYDEYFGANYDSWHQKMLSIYERYNKELGHTFHQEITDHKVLNDDLTCTTYADGTKVYVNYGNESQEIDGKVVPARDYRVVR